MTELPTVKWKWQRVDAEKWTCPTCQPSWMGDCPTCGGSGLRKSATISLEAAKWSRWALERDERGGNQQ